MLSKLWPARTRAEQPDGPISDLDEILARPVPFRFKGKIHKLEPITTEDFLLFSSAQTELMKAMSNTYPISAKELAQKIHRVFSSVCKTITVEDVESMQQAQVAALYQLVLDMITGQIDFGDGKKKRAKIPIYDIARVSSLPSAQNLSDGPQKKL